MFSTHVESEKLVLSWSTTLETLLEYDYLQTNGNGDDGPAAAHLVCQSLCLWINVRLTTSAGNVRGASEHSK